MERIHRLILCIFIFFATLILMSSCKSVQTIEKVNYRDSIVVHHKYDTTRITITDTSHVTASSESNKESETEIVFGAGGGTFNTQTGEATNVSSVKQSSKEKELQQLVIEQKTTIDTMSATIDEQKEQITHLEKELEEKQNTADIKPKRSGWDKFCTWYTIISWIVLLLCIAWWCVKKFYLHK